MVKPSDISGAQFSECRKFRYSLWRLWDRRRNYVNFVCLNPSTADEIHDDPTIRRCIKYSQEWGYGGLYITNIFAFRATDPKIMMAAADPVGPENDGYLELVSLGAGITVAAWGGNGGYRGRADKVLSLLNDPHYLSMTKSGHPGHPLYLKGDLEPQPLEE